MPIILLLSHLRKRQHFWNLCFTEENYSVLLQVCFSEIFFETLCFIFEVKQVKVGWSNLSVLLWPRRASPREEQPLSEPCPGTGAAAVQSTSKETAGGFLD